MDKHSFDICGIRQINSEFWLILPGIGNINHNLQLKGPNGTGYQFRVFSSDQSCNETLVRFFLVLFSWSWLKIWLIAGWVTLSSQWAANFSVKVHGRQERS